MYKFINPYNFIPLGKEKSKAPEAGPEKLLSGVIAYSVLTKTPLFIPNTSYDKAYHDDKADKDHKSYQFYSYVNYDDRQNREKIPNPEPVIPGSEIRGMFRSNFEILTNSCMSALDSDMKLSKRTMESFLPGLLRRVSGADGKARYDLVEAKDVLWRTMGANNTEDDLEWVNNKEHRNRQCYIQDQLKEGEHVTFQVKMRDRGKPLASLVRPGQDGADGTKGARCEGYIIKGEKSPEGPSRKHCCHIFMFNPLKAAEVRKNVNISLLDDLLEIYASNSLENASYYKEYRAQYEEFKAGKGNKYFPVYYSVIGNKMPFLAPACKTREIYGNTLDKLAGKLAPCTAKSGYCEACDLFGTVTSDGNAKSSRLRFTDLKAKEKTGHKDCYLPPMTLPELSSPKLNNMEFYLQRPVGKDGKGAYFWTYDYYIDKNGTLHMAQGRLSGRKFYWHQDLDDSYRPQEEKGKRNVTIHPVRSHVAFEGKIYFEKISAETLDKLIYLVNAGEPAKKIEQKEHGYKIGMAKPLGFGSIACQADEVKIKSYMVQNDMAEKKDLPYEDYSWEKARERLTLSSGGALVENFEKMTDFAGAGKKPEEHFSYPKIETGSEKGYEWYTRNHFGVDLENGAWRAQMPGERKKMKFREYLQAMEPRVKRIDEENGSPNRASQVAPGRENPSPKSAQAKKGGIEENGQDGNIQIGVVQPYKQAKSIKFKIGHSKAESLQCKALGISLEEAQKRFPEGSEIKVRFQGTSANGFKKYELVE